MVAALLAAVLVATGQILGWQGVDTAAQVYRVNGFRTGGFSLWDFQWYGGHWTLSYSVIYPAIASVVGVGVLAVASAALAALAFDRLARSHLGPGGQAASVVFALGTLVQAAIGQLPFLTGEAFGLAAAWAASRGRWRTAVLLGLASALSSPLAGAFVALGAAAWVLATLKAPDRSRRLLRAAALGAAAVGPVVVTAALFPGEGSMPYPFADYAWEIAVAAGIWIIAGQSEPLIRWGAALFAAVATLAVAVPSPLGGNIGRLEDVLALPIAVAFLWTRWRYFLPLAALPLAFSQWGPAWGALTAGPAQPSTHRSYFAPLDSALRRLAPDGPPGRVEVVPTAYHWEAAYVAPVMPLARGWERQLDVADNPVFYQKAALSPATYREWLIDSGVRFVALPEAPLDMAGRTEGRLVASGEVPGLRLVWRSANWRLYAVDGSPGIVPSPARLVSADGGRLVVDAPVAGSVLIRVRFSPDWVLGAGSGCVTRSGSSWIAVHVPRPEQFSLTLSLFGGSSDSCRSGPVAAPTWPPVPVGR